MQAAWTSSVMAVNSEKFRTKSCRPSKKQSNVQQITGKEVKGPARLKFKKFSCSLVFLFTNTFGATMIMLIIIIIIYNVSFFKLPTLTWFRMIILLRPTIYDYGLLKRFIRILLFLLWVHGQVSESSTGSYRLEASLQFGRTTQSPPHVLMWHRQVPLEPYEVAHDNIIIGGQEVTKNKVV